MNNRMDILADKASSPSNDILPAQLLGAGWVTKSSKWCGLLDFLLVLVSFLSASHSSVLGCFIMTSNQHKNPCASTFFHFSLIFGFIGCSCLLKFSFLFSDICHLIAQIRSYLPAICLTFISGVLLC